MFAVLGLMLASTFGAAISRHEAGKKRWSRRPTPLGTAFLHAALVDEPGRSGLQAALLTYARTRIADRNVVMTVERLEALLRQSWDAKAILWPATERVVRGTTPGAIGPTPASSTSGRTASTP